MKIRICSLALVLVALTSQAFAQGRGFCAVPAHELDPDKPTSKAFCAGTIWSTAKEGECVQIDKDDFCRKVGTTNVDIHQYKMKWNEEAKTCDLTPTGVSDTVKNVSNVTGRTCNIW